MTPGEFKTRWKISAGRSDVHTPTVMARPIFIRRSNFSHNEAASRTDGVQRACRRTHRCSLTYCSWPRLPTPLGFPTMVQPFLITADEVNCLIHSYFQDSGTSPCREQQPQCLLTSPAGFVHSAFVLHAEGRLDKSSHFGRHVPRGELIELLSKALLYSEVEAHWRGNAMTTNCKTNFSLLERHVCSLDPTLPASVSFNPPPAMEIPIMYTNGANGTTAEKRKASTPASEEGPKEKRVRTDDMDVDSVTSSAERTFTLLLRFCVRPVRPFSRG